MIDKKMIPPPLRRLAEEDGLSDEEVDACYRTSRTIRGKRPQTVQEWRELWAIIEKYF